MNFCRITLQKLLTNVSVAKFLKKILQTGGWMHWGRRAWVEAGKKIKWKNTSAFLRFTDSMENTTSKNNYFTFLHIFTAYFHLLTKDIICWFEMTQTFKKMVCFKYAAYLPARSKEFLYNPIFFWSNSHYLAVSLTDSCIRSLEKFTDYFTHGILFCLSFIKDHVSNDI